ncbi:MAG: hypothetical protein ABSD97_10410 [Acidimicrobiales bacterium]
MSRPPLDLTGRACSADEFHIARQIVSRSGVVAALAPYMDSEVGRHRRLSLEGLLVAFQINALQRDHQAHLIEAARILNGLNEDYRRRIGITEWDEDEAYARVTWLFSKLCKLLECAPEDMDAQWLANRLTRAAIPARYLSSRSVAVDGTDIETWGAFQGSVNTLELDGEAVETQLIEQSGPAPKTVRKAKVLGIGQDGRKIYTPDPDARAGHRSANGDHNAGPYIGYELHLGVQARDVRWTNFIDKTILEPEVPNVITTAVLAPAGSHRARSVVGSLIADKISGHDIDEVIWDPGYSLCRPETTTFPLTRAGISQTFQLVTSQRGIRPFSKEAILLDGQPYSRLVPIELRDLVFSPRLSSGNWRLAYEDFNRRARWRLVRHSAPDKDGVTRWRCPFCSGLLKSRNFPKTMRRPARVPLVVLDSEQHTCCEGTVSAPPVDLPLTQRIPFGTTAWRVSMNRRMAVESVNAALKGGFVNVQRGFLRVFGLLKQTVLLGFTLAGVNLDRVRSYRAKLAEADAQARFHTRRKRRVGIWSELLGELTVPDAERTGPPG